MVENVEERCYLGQLVYPFPVLVLRPPLSQEAEREQEGKNIVRQTEVD